MKRVVWVFVALIVVGAFGAQSVHAAGVVGTGTLVSCTEAAFDAALVGGGSVTFNCGGPATIIITSTKTISVNTIIDGAGVITISGNGLVSIFYVNPGATLQLVGLTVARGKDTSLAGGINNYGTLILNKTSVISNEGGNAGGIYSAGTARIASSRIEGNQAGLTGGMLNEGTATISSSQINKNRGGSYGGFANMRSATIYDTNIRGNVGQGVGGVENYRDATLDVIRSLVADNVGASPYGSVAGVRNYGGKLTFANSTISSNYVSSSGIGGFANYNGWSGLINATVVQNKGTVTGGLNNGAGTLQVQNTIIGKNAGAANCTGAITNAGNNIQYADGTCGAIPNIDPVLGSLAANGGPTFTHALLAGSPAIDTGNNAVCGAWPISNRDQRTFPRPVDGNMDAIAICDIGAFEAKEGTTGLTPTNTPQQPLPTATFTPSKTPMIPTNTPQQPLPTATFTPQTQITATFTPSKTPMLPTNTPQQPLPTATFTPQDPTKTPENPQLRPLTLTSVCSPDPKSYRVWYVTNVNSVDVDFKWEVIASGETDAVTATTSSDTYFKTTTVASNTVRIWVNGVVEDQKDSLEDLNQC